LKLGILIEKSFTATTLTYAKFSSSANTISNHCWKDEHYFEKRHSLRHTSETYTCGKVFYYPAVTEQLEENQSRCASHADETSITLLYQDEIGGLQVMR